MQIDIPSDDIKKLEQHAAAAGFGHVEQYVSQFVLALAEHPSADELFAPLTETELAESLAMIDRSMEQIEAGEGLTVDEARSRAVDELGFAGE